MGLGQVSCCPHSEEKWIGPSKRYQLPLISDKVGEGDSRWKQTYFWIFSNILRLFLKLVQFKLPSCSLRVADSWSYTADSHRKKPRLMVSPPRARWMLWRAISTGWCSTGRATIIASSSVAMLTVGTSASPSLLWPWMTTARTPAACASAKTRPASPHCWISSSWVRWHRHCHTPARHTCPSPSAHTDVNNRSSHSKNPQFHLWSFPTPMEECWDAQRMQLPQTPAFRTVQLPFLIIQASLQGSPHPPCGLSYSSYQRMGYLTLLDIAQKASCNSFLAFQCQKGRNKLEAN